MGERSNHRSARLGKNVQMNFLPQGKEYEMKYLFAWVMGVPGVLILLWFLMNHG